MSWLMVAAAPVLLGLVRRQNKTTTAVAAGAGMYVLSRVAEHNTLRQDVMRQTLIRGN